MRCLLLYFFFLKLPIWGANIDDKLQKAYVEYEKGIQATTFEEQKQAFNQSLFLLRSLEQEIASSPPILNRMLADTYFQLGEYPWAILYYQRALKQDPQDLTLSSLLAKTQKILGLPPNQPPLFPLRFFSFLQQHHLLFWSIFITFLLCSIAIWLSYRWIRQAAFLSIFFLFSLFFLSLFFYYSIPLEGILVHSTGFYRLPNEQQSQLTSQPLLAGSKVIILQMNEQRDWVKITDSNGTIGYIPAFNLRLI